MRSALPDRYQALVNVATGCGQVPLPESVAFALAGHLKRHPATRITLPWKTLDGPPVTASLIF
ncbi:hypothetical protein ACWDO6_05335 [Streptomyces sp. NPDC003674]